MVIAAYGFGECANPSQSLYRVYSPRDGPMSGPVYGVFDPRVVLRFRPITLEIRGSPLGFEKDHDRLHHSKGPIPNNRPSVVCVRHTGAFIIYSRVPSTWVWTIATTGKPIVREDGVVQIRQRRTHSRTESIDGEYCNRQLLLERLRRYQAVFPTRTCSEHRRCTCSTTVIER